MGKKQWPMKIADDERERVVNLLKHDPIIRQMTNDFIAAASKKGLSHPSQMYSSVLDHGQTSLLFDAYHKYRERGGKAVTHMGGPGQAMKELVDERTGTTFAGGWWGEWKDY